MVYDTLVVAGGTAGHVFPAISLATAKNHHLLLELNSKGIYDKYNHVINNLFYFSLSKNIFSIIKNMFSLFFFISRYNTVILMGSFYCLPAFILSVILNKKIIIYEQNAILGIANYIYSFMASEIYSSFNIINCSKYIYSGMPVHSPKYTAKNKRIILLLSGSRGSSYIEQFLDVIYDYAEKNDYTLYASCRNAQHHSKKYKNAVLKTFFADFEYLISSASLIIAHAGASTLSFLHMYNKAAILISLEHSVANHQIYNCIFSGFHFISEKNKSQSKQQLSLLLDDFTENSERFKSKWLFFKNHYI